MAGFVTNTKGLSFGCSLAGELPHALLWQQQCSMMGVTAACGDIEPVTVPEAEIPLLNWLVPLRSRIQYPVQGSEQ